MQLLQMQVLFLAICSQCLIASVTSNSLRGLQSTRSDKPMCLDHTSWSGGVIMRECNEGENQRWVRDGEVLKSQQDNNCLDYNVQDDRVTIQPCDGGNNQRWFFQGEAFKNRRSVSCLDFNFGTGKVFMNNCNEVTNQIWLWQEANIIYECEWSEAHWNKYPRGAAYMPRYSFEAAKRQCNRLGDGCKSITCSTGGTSDCVIATTATLRNSAAAGRATYICTRDGPKVGTITAMPRTTTTTTTTSTTTSSTTRSTTTTMNITTSTTTNITTATTSTTTTTTITARTTTAGTSTTITSVQALPVGSQQETGEGIPIVAVVVATLGCCTCLCLLVICLGCRSGKNRVDLFGNADTSCASSGVPRPQTDADKENENNETNETNETNFSNVVVTQEENPDLSNAFDNSQPANQV